MSRLFYDPSNPAMLSEEQVARMSSAEVQAATQQMDQILVSQLQRIEENFALSTQILNDVILQQVQKHGENSQAIYESIKFWRPFFEAAARTKLSDPYAPEPSIIADPNPIDLNPVDQSLEFDQPSVGQVTDQGTPRQPSFTRSPGAGGIAPTPTGNDSTGWPGAPVMSPLETLQADWRRVAASPEGVSVDLDAVRKGIDALGVNPGALDSPSLAMPDLSLDNSPPQQQPRATSSSSSVPPPKPSTSTLNLAPSPAPTRLRPAAAHHHPALLQKVLHQQQLRSPRPPGASTPAKGRAAFPADVPRGWDGVADLAETSLTAFASPITRSGAAGDESWAGDFGGSVAGGSPRPKGVGSGEPMAYALSPARYAATPAKQAARRTAKFAFDAEEDDDLAPPSVLKNYTTRYDFTLDQGGSPMAPSPSEGLRKGFEEEAYGDEEDEDEDEEDEDEENLAAVPAHLADFGGGTTARIDDLLAGAGEEDAFAAHANLDFGGLVVDDEDAPRPELLDDDEEEEEYPEGEDHGYDHHHDAGDESYVLEKGISQDGPREGPEDTLFGMQPKRVAYEDDDGEEDESFADGMGAGGAGGGGSQGWMKGPANIEQTLHGGELLDSEPFEGSPLAGRDRGGY